MSPTKVYDVKNYIVDVITWPKDLTRKTTYFEGWSWFKFNNLERTWSWNFTPVWQRIKIKSQKVLEANSNVCRNYIEKLLGGEGFLPTKSWIGLNELKWEDIFVDFIKGPLLRLTAEDCAIELSVLKLYLRDQSINLSFRIRLVDKSCSPFSSI